MGEAEGAPVLGGSGSGAVLPVPVKMWARYVEAARAAYRGAVDEAWKMGFITKDERDGLLAEEERIHGDAG